FSFFHGFTQEATPFSKSAMMLLVTLSYSAEMCMCSSSLPASENSGAGARGGGLPKLYTGEGKTRAPGRDSFPRPSEPLPALLADEIARAKRVVQFGLARMRMH